MLIKIIVTPPGNINKKNQRKMGLIKLDMALRNTANACLSAQKRLPVEEIGIKVEINWGSVLCENDTLGICIGTDEDLAYLDSQLQEIVKAICAHTAEIFSANFDNSGTNNKFWQYERRSIPEKFKIIDVYNLINRLKGKKMK